VAIFFTEYNRCVVGIYLGLRRVSSATVGATASLSGGVFMTLKRLFPGHCTAQTQ